MNIAHFSLHAYARPSRPGAQRGVVLFIALLVMVALSLAGIALIRSADTATIVAGNLAFKQAANSAVDRSVEQAIQALFNPGGPSPDIVDKTKHDSGQNYFACVLADDGKKCRPATDEIPEIPAALKTQDATKSLKALVPVDAADNKSYYVIERMCLYDKDSDPVSGRLGQPVPTNCNLLAAPGALGADAGTQHFEGLTRPGGAFYRVTVRVEGPRNTVAYAQAILQ